jgi:orotidine-5'-phosphate decarboxylase
VEKIALIQDRSHVTLRFNHADRQTARVSSRWLQTLSDGKIMRSTALAVAGATIAQPAAIELRDRLIVALDVPNQERALEIVQKLGDTVRFYKIGLQLQFAGGIELANKLIKKHKKVFLDSKIYDIDQTVKNAVANVAKMGVDFVTVHGNGSAIRAAVEGRGDYPLKIFIVTLLTSLDAHDMKDLGLSTKYSLNDIVLMRAKTALEAGCDGVIASGKEAAAIRKMTNGRPLLIVAPGIRSRGVSHHDQKRVSTPHDAIAAGADYLVVGRQILDAPDPKAMAESIFDEIEAALTH